MLTAQRGPGCLGELSLEVVAEAPLSTMADAGLEALRLSNPAARALPLLQLLAQGRAGTLHAENAGGGALRMQLLP